MTTKVMVSFPEAFLAEVDRVAEEEHRSRSELVREALRLYMGLRQDRGQPGADTRGRHRQAPGEGKERTTGAPPVREGPEGAYQTLAAEDRRIAGELEQRLAEIVPVRDLRVFGSRARGEAGPESDLDVFIEVAEATPELRRRISEIAWEVGFEWDRVISTVVATRDELEQGAMGANPLMLAIERDGVRP